MSERRILIDAYWDGENINIWFDRVVSLGMIDVSGLMDNADNNGEWKFGVVKLYDASCSFSMNTSSYHIFNTRINRKNKFTRSKRICIMKISISRGKPPSISCVWCRILNSGNGASPYQWK